MGVGPDWSVLHYFLLVNWVILAPESLLCGLGSCALHSVQNQEELCVVEHISELVEARKKQMEHCKVKMLVSIDKAGNQCSCCSYRGLRAAGEG